MDIMVGFDEMTNEELSGYRLGLETKAQCTNPYSWRLLADEFGNRGMLANQSKCLRLAEHYEVVQ